ncbi:MAG: polysaccharide deacetylase family protein [Kiloniellaceae bacterium]
MTGAETSVWQPLERELEAWGATGRRAAVWWRDDDADVPSPAFERLLAVAAASRAPLALAAIPAKVEPALAAVLAAQQATDTTVLQHGYAHADHAPAGAKKCELVDPGQRPAVIEELRRGRARLASLFGTRFRPVLVPPWNRIDPALVTQLPGLGFTGLSTYKARAAAAPATGLHQVNCHLDILQWRPQRRFLGAQAAVELLTGHLAARRHGTADAEEPSGILSHHQVHDDDAWYFLAELLDRLARHPAVRLLSAAEVFATVPAAGERTA